MNRRQAFTLIELLVVIAIIAVLMGILIPTLAKAREQARGIACVSNQKALVMAYITYADENEGSICGGFASYTPLNGVPSWVLPPLDYDGNGGIIQVTGAASLQQRFNGFKEGSLFPYIEDPKAYHCPGDFRHNRGTSLGNDPQYLIYRSYSLPANDENQGLGGVSAQDEKKLFNFDRHAEKFVFVEEIYDGAAGNHNHGSWSYDVGSGSLWDPLGIYHSNACTFSFMDGHAIRKKWEDPRTVIYNTSRDEAALNGYGRLQPFDPPNPDILWLDQHYPLAK